MVTGVIFGDLKTRSVNIDSNLASKTQFLVNLDTSDDLTVNIAAGATAPLYVLVDDGDGSSTALTGSIATEGRVKVKLGGNVNPGDKLTSDGNGKAIATTTDTDNFAGIAFTGGALNDVIEMDIGRGMIAG